MKILFCYLLLFIYLFIFKDWFAAGKGKNPDLISLDREMDDYFKSKTTKTSSEEVAVSATIDTTPSVAV